MRKLIFISGLPASGKTTYALKLVAKGYKRVNKDLLRSMIDNNVYNRNNERTIKLLQEGMIKFLLKEGYNVVVDNTHLGSKDYDDINALAKAVGNVELKHKHMDTPLEKCIIRNKKRIIEKPIQDEVIYRMNSKLNRYVVHDKVRYNKATR